ncbi:hypothetical protein IHE45_10G043700 [Dioscorea alata]|uniref:Uncharacterized protein n=1 Tax=Dioscorea alata TaxID=55571 RepID=A0ACB7VAG6_DIOAL|nr:hypothetical protein IHE45_10G043700 [Dioscorea alata]
MTPFQTWSINSPSHHSKPASPSCLCSNGYFTSFLFVLQEPRWSRSSLRTALPRFRGSEMIFTGSFLENQEKEWV